MIQTISKRNRQRKLRRNCLSLHDYKLRVMTEKSPLHPTLFLAALVLWWFLSRRVLTKPTLS